MAKNREFYDDKMKNDDEMSSGNIKPPYMDEMEAETKMYVQHLIDTDEGYKKGVQNEIDINKDAILCMKLGISYGELQGRRLLGILD